MAALQDPATAAAALREQLQQTFGDDARNVALRADDGRVGIAEAVTIDETVFIGRWYDDDALLRVGHEVAHAIQQRRGRAMGETDAVPLSSGRRTSLEIEAERAGHALVGGLRCLCEPLPSMRAIRARSCRRSSRRLRRY